MVQITLDEYEQHIFQDELIQDQLDINTPISLQDFDADHFDSFGTLSDTKKARASNGFAIVVGHTLRAQGARGTHPISGHEYVWNKHLATLISKHANDLGVPTKIFYRDGIGISGAYKQAEKWGSAFVVELHFNAFNTTATGTETLYSRKNEVVSRPWADLLQKAQVNVMGLTDRGLKPKSNGERGYQSVSALAIPIALIEPFFGDNPGDASVGEQKKDFLAKEIAAAAHARYAVS